jgi:heptosyltransferase-2
MTHILVMRGGAVGDMVVTLPAFAALRHVFPSARIDVLGAPSRAVLAQHPRYADRILDQDSWDVYRLFSARAPVSARLTAYLRACDLVLAYLPAADATFVRNVRRFCPGDVLVWPPQPAGREHATAHLLGPVTAYGAGPYALQPHVYLDPTAMAEAAQFWQTAGLPAAGVVALHPGSGGRHKLWPLTGWQRVMAWAAQRGLPCLMISGPAEQERVAQLLRQTRGPAWPCVTQRTLPQLAALLARCRVVLSHDSGVAHLAAAVGTTTLALFGPTDPYVWGPRSRQACVLQPATPGELTLASLPPERVIATLEALLCGAFVFTPSAVDCTIVTVQT